MWSCHRGGSHRTLPRLRTRRSTTFDVPQQRLAGTVPDDANNLEPVRTMIAVNPAHVANTFLNLAFKDNPPPCEPDEAAEDGVLRRRGNPEATRALPGLR